MPLHFKDAQGADVSIGGFFWKDAAGAVTAISEGHVKFGNVASQFWSSGMPVSSLPVGTLVSINENGSPVLFYLAKHDYESGLNGPGRTLLVRKDGHSRMAWDAQNSNTYPDSDIDLWFNNTYKASLDTKVQTAIGETTFHYSHGATSAVTTMSRSVFALSLTELGQSNSAANVEGSALPIASTLQPILLNGSNHVQWTRTPDKNRYWIVFNVAAAGVGSDSATSYYSARPCFTLRSNAKVNPEPNADGSYTLLV